MTEENSSKNKDLSPVSVQITEKGENTSQSGDKNLPEKRKRGRPPGAKNKDTIFKELMRDDFQALATTEVKKVFNVLFEKAQDGDMQAIKLVLDRVIPPNKAVDINEKAAGGIQVEIHIGKLEENPMITGEVIEDAEYEEV